MKYEELNEKEIEEHEKLLIQRADDFWIEMYGKKEASDVDKLRLLSRQGKLNDVFQHNIMTHYFRKQGLWTDGRTTLMEREKQLILKKTEFGKKISDIKGSKIRDIDRIIKKAQEKKEVLDKIPVKLIEEFKINKGDILNKLAKDLDSLYITSKVWIDKEIHNIHEEFINTTKNQRDNLINKAHTDLEELQRQQKIKMESEVKNFSAELEAELTVLDYIEKDNETLEKYNEEIKTINQELNELTNVPIKEPEPQLNVEVPLPEPIVLPKTEVPKVEEQPNGTGLDILTVQKLKEICDANGLKYDAHTRKAELIALING